jgi:hypothetical protein
MLHIDGAWAEVAIQHGYAFTYRKKTSLHVSSINLAKDVSYCIFIYFFELARLIIAMYFLARLEG